MDNTPPLTVQRPLPPQRSASGSALYVPKASSRPGLPSRLSHVRSVSQPGYANVVDLTADGAEGYEKNATAFLGNRNGIVTSPNVIDLEEQDGAPPAKKAKTSGTGFRADGCAEDKMQDADMDMAHYTRPRSPLPSLPKTKPSKAAMVVRSRSSRETAARKADGIEPPPMATRLPRPKNVADFSPWNGQHPEDVMNETVVKSGFFDKGPGPNQTDSNSAKPSIWPNLSQKNNMGLQTLSYLFTQVMEKRQTLGKCTAPSTFKPPPRVTVTDTKREAWLRDLANPDVPLRKQSRTIPHGIRGKLLMDQCLGKDIPLQRAVWLAKCVGANELRAFRRKGVSGAAAASGESKWAREWTVQVEQFLEGIVGTCGQADWSNKMNYAVKLATCLYTEKLLDTDHYLDWIVTTFAEAALDRLYIWIVLVQIYWKDIVRLTRRGRRLAESVLGHLHDIMQSTSGANDVLKTRLQKIIAVLAVTSRGCLVIPRTWAKYSYLLTPATTPESTTGETAAQSVAKRNERLIRPHRKAPNSTRTGLLDLYDKLDSVGLDVHVDNLAEKISLIVPDRSKLVPALLDWACSPYREGLARTYLTARLVAHLRGAGHETDIVVLHKLRSAAQTTSAQIDGIHKVVSELVRLDSFSVGRYMQWLITSGALSNQEESSHAAGLLAALPSDTLPVHVQNTRRMLLKRLGAIEDQQSESDQILANLDLVLQQSSLEYVSRSILPDGLSLPAKARVGHHIRSSIRDHAARTAINTNRFCVLRDCLERIEDVLSLIELVDAAVDTDDATQLAAVVDTVDMHAESLAALGQLQPLLDRLTDQYRHLRSHQPLDRTLILSFICLTKRVRDQSALLELLAGDLAICEQQISLAVCSPASDNLIGMHASSLDSDSDIDAVFASGNMMDEQLLQRVFMRVVQRALKPFTLKEEPVSKISRWLDQLRTLGGSSFDQLAHAYVQSVFNQNVSDSTASTGAVTALIASGCIEFNTVINVTKAASSPEAALKALRMLSDPHAASANLSLAEEYRYRVRQMVFCSDHALDVVEILCRASDSPLFDPNNVEMGDLLIRLSARSYNALKPSFTAACQTQASVANAGRMCKALLKRGLPSASITDHLDLKAIMHLANPLSVRFCAGALEYTVREGAHRGSGADLALLDLMVESITDGSSVWPVLLGAVSKQTKQALHEWAQDRLLYPSTDTLDSETTGTKDIALRYLDVLDATHAYAKDDNDLATVTTLAGRLKDYENQLTADNATDTALVDNATPGLWKLDTLLDVCVLHVQARANETEVAQQSCANLLLALCSLLIHPELQMHKGTCDYIFDLASTLAENIPETVVLTIARSGDTAGMSDPRVQSILGHASTISDGWLALASQAQPAGTQQQRALNKHPSQQGQQAGSRPGSLSQASISSPQHTQPPRSWPHNAANRVPVEMKTTPYTLRRWEIMPDPTPVMGENDTSLSLRLFGARRA